LRTLHPEVRWRPPLARLQGRTYKGHEGVERWYGELSGSFDGVGTELFELRDLGERVLVRGRGSLRARGSPATMDESVLVAIEVRDGLIARFDSWFRPPPEVLEQVGWEGAFEPAPTAR
jgi:hypothetical protein